jgi:hypothetical protein
VDIEGFGALADCFPFLDRPLRQPISPSIATCLSAFPDEIPFKFRNAGRNTVMIILPAHEVLAKGTLLRHTSANENPA